MSKYNSSNDDAIQGVLIVFGVMALIAFAIGLFAYMVWAGAFVGATLWAWFIVPTFKVAALTKAQAWGIALLVSFWTYHYKSIPFKDERETKEKVLEVCGLLLYPWVVLFFGWVCHAWFYVPPAL